MNDMTQIKFYSLVSGASALGAIFFWGTGRYDDTMVCLGLAIVSALWAIKEKITT